MSLFNINFNNKAVEWLPPDKRNPVTVNWLQALFAPIVWLQNKYLNQYLNGDTYTQWSSTIATGTGYATDAIIEHKQVVYTSLIDANHDTPPSVNWQQYLPSFLGTMERVKFDGKKLNLEFALNEYFKAYGTNFRQPGLLGYSYPSNTPGTPTTPTIDNPLHSDIFILNNAYEVVGFNVGTRDFIPANWVSSHAYTAGLSKVMYPDATGHEYICTTTNTDATFNASHWTDLGALPTGYILTAGVVTKDITDVSDYPLWTNQNYTMNDAVTFQDFVYVCTKSTTSSQAPDDKDYWFKIDGLGYNNPFLLGDNFTIYLPAAVFALTNTSEIDNFVNKIVDCGTRHNIATY